MTSLVAFIQSAKRRGIEPRRSATRLAGWGALTPSFLAYDPRPSEAQPCDSTARTEGARCPRDPAPEPTHGAAQ